ncbi:MAG: hypothetical protein ACYTE1_04340 [Planctomycetota bacterium]|jgi:hypothetical protein
MNELTQTQKTKTPKWFQAVLLAGMLLFAFYASTHMVAAGDTWVAMACGRHFADHGVDTVEPFSFNSHPAQNWLTHLIFYKLATWFGEGDSYNYNTLVYWKFAIYFLAVICVYATGRMRPAG